MKAAKKLIQLFEICNQRHGLLKKNDSLVLAVSGGPDSVALLALFSLLRRKYSLKLFVAHMNHGWAPKASREYETRVERLCREFSVPFYCQRINLKKEAKRLKRSLEEVGRIKRYEFFQIVAFKTKSKGIVTAHTLDDQAETMLLRILRGSGVKGLGGIPYKRKEGRFKLIRPLLDMEKKDLVQFLRKNNISFCVDQTNKDRTFSRNRVRHTLLKLLERDFNPNIKRSLANLQWISRDIQEFMEISAREAFRRCRTVKRPGHVTLCLNTFKKRPRAIQREVLLQALEELQGHLKRIELSHISAILDMINSSSKEVHQVRLPHSISVVKKLNLLTLRSNKAIIQA